MITVYNNEDFKSMRKAGKLASHILDYITPYVVEGITTNELNNLCHNEIIANNAIPAPLGYNGYPKSVCISVNEVVCHGIPSERKLKNGDIVNIDVTVILDGWHGDTSRMYTVGNVSNEAKKLIDVTHNAMMSAISILKPGVHIGDIGGVITSIVHKYKFSVVRDYCGHGIGKNFHESPFVFHHSRKGEGILLKTGYCFTIEPMINIGKHETMLLPDGWTAVTADGSLSAQFEHTVGITKDGVEIFTL